MEFQTEKQLQAACVRHFSQNHGGFAGCFFAIRGETFSAKHAANQLAMGQVYGIADTCLLAPQKTVFIEFKLPGKRHNLEHVRRQMNWARETRFLSDVVDYYIVTSLNGFEALVANSVQKDYTPTIALGVLCLSDIYNKVSELDNSDITRRSIVF